MVRFRDRADAGAALARLVSPMLETDDAVVLAIPRGGVVVGRVLADALGLRLDVLAVRKLGIPGHEEYGFGAIGEDGVMVLDQATLAATGLGDEAVAVVETRERSGLERRLALYATARTPVSTASLEVVIVDDGIAMGGTMRAAVAVCRARGVARVVIAVGVSAPDTLASLAHEADAAVAALVPNPMFAVGEWYDDFAQTSDAEVLAALVG